MKGDIAKETFERLVAALDGGDDIEASFPLMDQVGRQEGWGEDEPDLYADLDPRR